MFVSLLSKWYISLRSTWIYEIYLFRNDVMDFCWYFKWKHFWVEAMIIYRGFQFLPLSSYKLFFSIKFYSMCSLGFLKPHQKAICITNFHFEYCIIILHTESRSCDGYWIFRKFLSLDGMSYDSKMKGERGYMSLHVGRKQISVWLRSLWKQLFFTWLPPNVNEKPWSHPLAQYSVSQETAPNEYFLLSSWVTFSYML